jgi:membrane protein required for colicin V production
MVLDFVILLAVALGFLQGYRRGLLNSVFFLCAFFIGSIIALRFGYLVALFLNRRFGIESEYLPLISLAILFMAVLVGILLIARSLEGILKKVKLNLFNRIAGGVLWAVAAVYVASLAFWYLEKYEVVTDDVKAASVTYPYFGELSREMTEALGRAVPFVLDTYYDLDEMMEDFQRENLPPEESKASQEFTG